jgi:hypothetical protein
MIPRLTPRVLSALASAVAAMEASADPENEHPGVTEDDMKRARNWVRYQQDKQRRKADAR